MNDNTSKALTQNLLSDEIMPLYYYKVIELTPEDQDDSEVREYEFKHGDFIANKLDAEDWYKKRKLAFENTKELQIRSKEYHHLNQSLELILIERFSEQEQMNIFSQINMELKM